MSWTASTAPHRQCGAAALIVVVVLFFILALVTAYTGRNLVFEQRISANNLRATQAFEAAEAGLEFAVAALGAGRVDPTCAATADTAQASFRQRHTTQDANGNFIDAGGQAGLRPACMVLGDGTLSCSCPAAALPDLVLPVGPVPTFQLRFETGIAQPGVVRVVSRGCSSVGTQCYAAAPGPADAEAEVSVLLGLNSALATPPGAALTARGSVDLGGGPVTLSNSDVASGGVTIDAGGGVVNDGAVRLFSVAGTPGSASVQANDPSLSELDANRMFVSLFGMDKTTYRTQPAVVRLACNGNCAQTIADAVSANPGRVVWVDGDVTFDTTQVLGSAAQPVVLIVHGNLSATANLQLHGLLYLHTDAGATNWTTAAGTTSVHGAVIAEGSLGFVGTPTITFDPVVLRTINLTQGSLVRIPGSWRDFAAGS
jgi:PilX N-terminal